MAKRKEIIPLLLKGDTWIEVQAIQYIDVRNHRLPPKNFYEKLEKILHNSKKPRSAKSKSIDKKTDTLQTSDNEKPNINWAEFTKEAKQIISNTEEIINKQFDVLFEMITLPLTEYILENSIKPALYNWRSGKIKTLKDLQLEANHRAQEWMKTDELQNILLPLVTIWIKNLNLEIDKSANPFYKKYDIRDEYRFSISPDLSIPNVGTIPDKDEFRKMFKENIHLVNALVAGTIVYILIFLTSLVGPLGWIIDTIVMITAYAIATATGIQVEEWLNKKILDINLPVFIRKTALPDNKILHQVADAKTSLKEELHKTMKKDLQPKLFITICDGVKQEMEKQVKRMEDYLKETNL